MSIIYDPKSFAQKIMSDKKIKSLLKGNLSLKKAAFKLTDKFDIIDKKDVVDVALKTVSDYKQRIKLDPTLKDEILDDPKQLIQRVQNNILFQVKETIKTTYEGEQYTWLPSDADEPDPEHQLNYGKVFTVGDGEMPGDRYGCRCGMEILVQGYKLEL